MRPLGVPARVWDPAKLAKALAGDCRYTWRSLYCLVKCNLVRCARAARENEDEWTV